MDACIIKLNNDKCIIVCGPEDRQSAQEHLLFPLNGWRLVYDDDNINDDDDDAAAAGCC